MEEEKIILTRSGESVSAELNVQSLESLLGFLSTLFEALMQGEDVEGKKRILRYISMTSVDAFAQCVDKEN